MHWPAGGGGACWQHGSSGSCGALPSAAACSGRIAAGNWCCAAAPFGSGEVPEPTAIRGDFPAIDTAACNLASIAPVHYTICTIRNDSCQQLLVWPVPLRMVLEQASAGQA